MRPVPQLLSALGGAGCLLALAAGPAAAADADATPRLVEPGSTVTVLVSCDRVEGGAPRRIEARSPAFTGQRARLTRVTPEEEDPRGGPSYRGRAKISKKAEFDDSRPGGRTSEWDVHGVCPGGEQWAAAFRIDETPPDAEDGAGGSDTSTAAAGPQRDARQDGRDRAEGATGPVRNAVADEGGQGQISTAAVAGGSAVLTVAVVAAVCWRRRSVVGPRSTAG
ncbi:hypothetical protein MTQ01_14875 [Streptomyces sp. XM4193]|uniref:hypothetical protein n=1 Tax=Streptomyces sp. XM4193 TaxID=2929782 RepID=UPI001FF8F687|nr:hypothetical protein [Streptomyces sp. XM4193]MCK1797281.1 hypothetical protein [Streptomyces sp. XM4193]